MFTDAQVALATRLLATLRLSGLTLVSAESCTGGLIAALFTDIAGASDVFDRGFVTYSNEAKSDLLGVPPQLIGRVGAVSAEVAVAMANGAAQRGRGGSSAAIAVTGIAGPGGGSIEKPVGLVHIAAAWPGQATRQRECRFGPLGRRAVRMATVDAALELLALFS